VDIYLHENPQEKREILVVTTPMYVKVKVIWLMQMEKYEEKRLLDDMFIRFKREDFIVKY